MQDCDLHGQIKHGCNGSLSHLPGLFHTVP